MLGAEEIRSHAEQRPDMHSCNSVPVRGDLSLHGSTNAMIEYNTMRMVSDINSSNMAAKQELIFLQRRPRILYSKARRQRLLLTLAGASITSNIAATWKHR